jgi:hypothetical protein
MQSSVLQDGTAEGELPETVSCFDGVFYNYFSIGTFFFTWQLLVALLEFGFIIE